MKYEATSLEDIACAFETQAALADADPASERNRAMTRSISRFALLILITLLEIICIGAGVAGIAAVSLIASVSGSGI